MGDLDLATITHHAKDSKEEYRKAIWLSQVNFSKLKGYEFMVRAQLLNFRNLLGRNRKLRH